MVMSNLLKALAVIAAITLGILALQILPGGANDRRDEAPAESDRPPAHSPRAGRRPDVPLQHAILRDEKKVASADAALLEALAKPTTVEFQDLPLEDCLTFLREYHNINIWLDRGSLTDEGVALDQPITLKLAGVSLESVLHLLLQPVQLEWVIQDEVMKITTVSWTRKHPETRTYDVHNLIEAGHTPEELMASITKCIEPASWTGKEATAAIAHTAGILVIRQSQPVHGEIGRLLEDLDTAADAAEDEDAEKGGKNAVVSVKVYPTGAQSPEQLAECLKEFVASKSWTNQGGKGKVLAMRGKLVIEQTAGVHRAIQQFISQVSSKSPVDSPTTAVSAAAAGVAGTGSSVSRSPADPADPFRVLNQASPPAEKAGASPAAQKKDNKAE
jgi:hypothetical protein